MLYVTLSSYMAAGVSRDALTLADS
jgi:hypothetical protein